MRRFWGDLSPACLAELDRGYMDRDVTRNLHSEPGEDPAEGDKQPWGPLPLRDRLVWRHVFEDPLALRSVVDAAMADPQCLAMRGEAPHRLREVCAADAFSRLSVLHRACGLLQVAARLGSVWANTQAGGDGAELNASAKSTLALAYVRRASGAALGHYESPRMHLPYLLAARHYDLRADAQLDWSELEERFAKAEIDLARPILEGILRQGWRPMEERGYKDVTWPWAIAPRVAERHMIRQRLDQAGNMRWIYPGGSEEWIDDRGAIRIHNADGSEAVMYHGDLTDRQLPHLRSWVDDHGRPRWLDNYGMEHWIDADGAEHWIDFGGTEWILLPPEPPPGSGPRR